MLVQYYKPTPLIIAERFAFHKRDQLPEEKVNINDFLIKLTRLAQTCDFGEFLEQALRDIFICGLANTNLQNRLLTEKKLTLERAIVIATAMEMAVLEPHKSKDTVVPPRRTEEEINHIGHCYCCGKKSHIASQCRFRTYKCHKCNKVGHLQAVCPGDKNTLIEKQKVEKQQGHRSSTSI